MLFHQLLILVLTFDCVSKRPDRRFQILESRSASRSERMNRSSWYFDSNVVWDCLIKTLYLDTLHWRVNCEFWLRSGDDCFAVFTASVTAWQFISLKTRWWTRQTDKVITDQVEVIQSEPVARSSAHTENAQMKRKVESYEVHSMKFIKFEICSYEMSAHKYETRLKNLRISPLIQMFSSRFVSTAGCRNCERWRSARPACTRWLITSPSCPNWRSWIAERTSSRRFESSSRRTRPSRSSP